MKLLIKSIQILRKNIIKSMEKRAIISNAIYFCEIIYSENGIGRTFFTFLQTKINIYRKLFEHNYLYEYKHSIILMIIVFVRHL